MPLTRIKTTAIDHVFLSEFLGTVASESAMLALVGGIGDYAVRSDLNNDSFIITQNNGSSIGDWQKISNTSTALLKSENLNDLPDAGTARSNLGLGTASTTAATDYATAAQGTKADSALQPTNNLNDLNDVGTALDNLGFSAFGKSIIDDADAAAVRTTLGLGEAATSDTLGGSQEFVTDTNVSAGDTVALKTNGNVEKITPTETVVSNYSESSGTISHSNALKQKTYYPDESTTINNGPINANKVIYYKGNWIYWAYNVTTANTTDVFVWGYKASRTNFTPQLNIPSFYFSFQLSTSSVNVSTSPLIKSTPDHCLISFCDSQGYIKILNLIFDDDGNYSTYTLTTITSISGVPDIPFLFHVFDNYYGFMSDNTTTNSGGSTFFYFFGVNNNGSISSVGGGQAFSQISTNQRQRGQYFTEAEDLETTDYKYFAGMTYYDNSNPSSSGYAVMYRVGKTLATLTVTRASKFTNCYTWSSGSRTFGYLKNGFMWVSTNWYSGSTYYTRSKIFQYDSSTNSFNSVDATINNDSGTSGTMGGSIVYATWIKEIDKVVLYNQSAYLTTYPYEDLNEITIASDGSITIGTNIENLLYLFKNYISSYSQNNYIYHITEGNYNNYYGIPGTLGINVPYLRKDLKEVSFDNASNIIGISTETATAGSTINVTVFSGVNSNLSNLTVGSDYYVLGDGSLSTSNNLYIPNGSYGLVGKSIGSTKILIK